MILFRLVPLMSVLLLGACAMTAPPPAITYDQERPAVAIPEPPRPVEIVTITEPLPLPGQLLPAPAPIPAKPDKRKPAARVVAANQAALLEPSRDGYINAVQVYPFTEGALYRLYAAPEQVSDIALEPGEGLVAVSAGDTVRWVIGDTFSGAGASKRVHILVKPFVPSLKTNLVITTDRRTYHLALESTKATAMAAVSWTYPADALMALKARNAKAEASAASTVESGIALDRLRFRYAISGDTPAWKPLRAFDDGAKVYIEFPARLDQGEAPPLFIVGPDGGAELVNYRVRGNWYVVDRLFAAAELRLGTDPQQVVRITRTDGIKTAHVDPLAQGGAP
ncbi:MAG: P-type conjugative transfer protein TrbG [Magnetospirillum sp.]|nr:P-type conjugative transfer protein TrbG [Magnetospirillum sp.]MCR6632601.1 P-type conjugative transfer protein TrbG [Magnetospirillum sp.]